MAYILEVCDAGLTKEVRKYYSSRYHSHEARNEHTRPTSEAMKRVNQRQAEIKLRRLMNTNFKDGDFLIRLDFSKWLPIDSIEMQNMMSGAMRKLKRMYQKEQKVLKYIYVKEIGPRGSRHVHLMINKIDTDILLKWWKYGGLHIDPLHSGGQYSKIAAYFIKYAAKTEETEGKLIGKRWYASQSLQKPKIKKKIIKFNRFKNEPRVPKGWFLEKGSVYEGASELTGYEYFGYTLIKQKGADDDS